ALCDEFGAAHCAATGHRGRSICDCGCVGLGSGVSGVRDAEFSQNLLFDLGSDLGMLDEESARILHSLPKLVAVVGVPGAALLDEPVLHAEIDERPLTRYSGSIQNVELGLLEGRGHLV